MRTCLAPILLAHVALGIEERWGGNNDNQWGNGNWGNGNANGWGGGPGGWGGFGPSCASSCVSSYWASITPTPTAFCDSNKGLASCLSSACSSDSAALETFSSRSSSACSLLSSCSSTGTYTYTWGSGWPWGDGSSATASPVTVTGCPWDDGPWGFGWGPGGGGGGGPGGGWGGDWGNWGSGWRYTTRTETVTVTKDSGDITPSAVIVAQAVSGTETRKTTFTDAAAQASETGSGGGSGASGFGESAAVKAIGACLAVALFAVGMM